jgi:hypothetical protein
MEKISTNCLALQVFENAMQVEGNVNLAQNLNSREWVVLKML